MYAIETDKLQKTYDGKQMALDDCSISIGQGEIFGFLGPNGSGKTTMIRLLNGVLSPSGGGARVLGRDVETERTDIHRMCGVMTETASLYENLSGMENLQFFGRLHGMADVAIAQRSRTLLESMELTDARDKKVKAYSTGMKRRLSLVRCLLHSPSVLFLDEPTSGLDPEAAMNVTQLIRQLSIEHGVTVFLCTHQLKYAQEICTLYGFIHKGKILGLGTFDELLRRKNSKRYLEIRGEGLPAFAGAERIDDRKLRIPIENDEDAAKILAEAMRQGGKIFEMKQVQWNLEDLYLSFQKGEST